MKGDQQNGEPNQKRLAIHTMLGWSSCCSKQVWNKNVNHQKDVWESGVRSFPICRLIHNGHLFIYTLDMYIYIHMHMHMHIHVHIHIHIHPGGSVTGVRKWSKLLRPHSEEPVFAFKTYQKKRSVYFGNDNPSITSASKRATATFSHIEDHRA